jgi:hypothetical protein
LSGAIMVALGAGAWAGPTFSDGAPGSEPRTSLELERLPNTDVSLLMERLHSHWVDPGLALPSPWHTRTGASTEKSTQVKTIPPLPGAAFLGLVGVLCLTLVRDRKTWAGFLLTLLSFSQAGLLALPELAWRLGRSKIPNKRPLVKKSLKVIPQQTPLLARGLSWDRRYLGLLRRVAAWPPRWQPASSRQNQRLILAEASRSKRRALYALGSVVSSPAHHDYMSLNPLAPFGAGRIRASELFSPACIFSNLSRGPPAPKSALLFPYQRD